MSEGVDYSRYVDGLGAALQAAGKSFAVRYLWSPSSGGLSNAEIADLRAHGVSIAIVMEQNPADSQAGFDKGVAHAQLAVQRLAALQLDQSLPIYFATDQDVSWAAVSEYYRGAASVIGAARTGIYAGIRPVQGAQGSGLVAWYWQTYAWSGGKVAAGIHLLQYDNGNALGGTTVDYCRSYQDNYGQSAPASAPVSGDDDLQMRAIYCDVYSDAVPKGSEYGSTGVILPSGKFVRTSTAMGPRDDLNAHLAIADVNQIPHVEIHVDQNGYVLESLFV